MLQQTLVWTALPDGSDGPLQEGGTVRLSAFMSPRLLSTTPQVKEKLGSYPDFLDWPAKIKGASFAVDFGDGVARPATPDFNPLRSDLWLILFNDKTDVIPYEPDDFSGDTFVNGPVAIFDDILKGVYQDVGTDPVMGSGKELPKAIDLRRHSLIGALGRPYVPERPYVPPAHAPITIPGEEPPPYDASPPDTGPGPGPGGPPSGGCLSGCLLLPLQIVRAFARLLGLVLMTPFMTSTVNVSTGQANKSSKELVDLLSADQSVLDNNPEDLPTEEEVKDYYDFHKMVSAAGDYRWLMRALGLVVDLTVMLEAPLPAKQGTVKVTPTLTMSLAKSSHVSMQTHYDLGDNLFMARPRPANPEISGGMLRVEDEKKFRVIQVDAVGGGVKLINMASNLPVLADDDKKAENTPDEAGLPALRTAGLALVKPNLAKSLKDKTFSTYENNMYVAGIDGSPLKPYGGEGTPKASGELYAEDLVRGYCIDVFDDHSQKWHSLCERVGIYVFGNGQIKETVVDEGFVSLGATQPAKPKSTSEPKTLRLFETLVTWGGWSLAAPRPGRTILSEIEEPPPGGPPPGQADEPPAYKTAYPSNPAVTNFPMSCLFDARPGSLPRLRFGWKYRLRARVVDLAGNRVTDPSKLATFQDDVQQKTAEYMYGRFEPVDAPPVVLKEVPALGESLERLVVASTIDQSAQQIAGLTSERHIVPPKTSQLMAEQLGHFDGPIKMLGDKVDYQTPIREAATFMEQVDPLTLTLKPTPGAKEVKVYQKDPGTGDPQTDGDGKPIILHTYYLQTLDNFEVHYLPDPLARGVLLLGLPGMAGFEQVIEPSSGKIVNKIPFEGAWPNPKPFRLRLQGLKEDQQLFEPNWDGAKRILTVGARQGETYEVRISSYFEAADLAIMGVWQWIEETAVADLPDLKGLAEQGRNWMHLPWRTLVLVHAVKQPLKVPTVDELKANRVMGDTGARLVGKITVDGKSTGKLDLRATWQDPLDDPAKGKFNPLTDFVSQDMHVIEKLVEDKAGDLVDVDQWPHELGDTKYHRVTYQALGTTRFREYFDPPITEPEIKDMMRPRQKDVDDGTAEAAKLPIHVPNTARPDAPEVLYVLPTFLWEDGQNGSIFWHRRAGGGLRVYLARPWYSSGAGELLGVLVRPRKNQDSEESRDSLVKLVSQWGMDPIWDSAHTEPLYFEHLMEFAKPAENLSLEEAPRKKAGDALGVDVAGYEVRYDPDKDAWFAEVIFEPIAVRSYFPFVRLALARFQPRSVGDAVESAHLSRVVRTDFTQLPPERLVTYETANLAAGTVDVRVSGPAGFKFEQLNRMVVSVEARDPRVVDEKDPLGWRQVGDYFALKADASQGPENVVWQGTVNLGNNPPSPLRLVVREWEVLAADEKSTVLLPGESDEGPPPGSIVEIKPQRSRTVFADELILP